MLLASWLPEKGHHEKVEVGIRLGEMIEIVHGGLHALESSAQLFELVLGSPASGLPRIVPDGRRRGGDHAERMSSPAEIAANPRSRSARTAAGSGSIPVICRG